MRTTFLLLLAMLSSAVTSAQVQVVGTATTQIGGITRTETTIQDGPLPINQFKMLRLVRTHLPEEQLRAVVFLLPSLGIDFSSYEETEPHQNFSASIAGFFAQRGFAVYGYSSRLEGLSAGGCEAGLYDCSVMQGWNLQQFVDDVAFIRSQIAAAHPGLQVFAGGLSLGGIGAVAVMNDAGGDYDGFFVWEGMLFTPDPQVQALNQVYCAGLEAQLMAGLYFDGVGGNLLKKINKLAQLQPGGLTPIPLFPSFLTNRQVLVSALSVPTPGPVSMPVPDYILFAGNPATGELFFASDERLFENVSRFNDYAPNALVRDISCTLAGVETSYISNLAAYDGPILGIGGGRGFGPYMADNFALTSSTDVVMLLEPDFGHVDHLMTPFHRFFVEFPILDWIVERLD